MTTLRADYPDEIFHRVVTRVSGGGEVYIELHTMLDRFLSMITTLFIPEVVFDRTHFIDLKIFFVQYKAAWQVQACFPFLSSSSSIEHLART